MKEIGSLKRHAELLAVPAHIGKRERADGDLHPNRFGQVPLPFRRAKGPIDSGRPDRDINIAAAMSLTFGVTAEEVSLLHLRSSLRPRFKNIELRFC